MNDEKRGRTGVQRGNANSIQRNQMPRERMVDFSPISSSALFLGIKRVAELSGLPTRLSFITVRKASLSHATSSGCRSIVHAPLQYLPSRCITLHVVTPIIIYCLQTPPRSPLLEMGHPCLCISNASTCPRSILRTHSGIQSVHHLAGDNRPSPHPG